MYTCTQLHTQGAFLNPFWAIVLSKMEDTDSVQHDVIIYSKHA
jgi:hypothetical protein